MVPQKLCYIKNGTTDVKYGLSWKKSELDSGTKPVLPYDEDIDGPRSISIKSNNEYRTWGLNEDTSNQQAAIDEINNTPTNNQVTGNTTTTTIGAGGGTILNTKAIVAHTTGIDHGQYRAITCLWKMPLKIFNNGVNYEAHVKGKVRYYYPGGGDNLENGILVSSNPAFGASMGQFSNLGEISGLFVLCCGNDVFTSTNTIAITRDYPWEFPYVSGFDSKINGTMYSACDKAKKINSITGFLGPANEVTGGGGAQGMPPGSSTDWGRLFDIDVTVPIGGDWNSDLSIVIGVNTHGWGSAGGSGYYGGGNSHLWFQLQDLSASYTAGWGGGSKQDVKSTGVYVISQDVGKELSALNYKKSNSSTSYRLFTDPTQGGGGRLVKNN